MISIFFRSGLFIFLSSFSGVLLAHTGHIGTNSLLSGLIHPFTGIAHIVAVLLVGFWAVRFKGLSRLWFIMGFVGFVLAGITLSLYGLTLFNMEAILALSVLTLGLILFYNINFYPVILVLLAAFSLFHGQAHTKDMIFLFSPTSFISGFLIGSSALLSLGILTGDIMHCMTGRWLVRITGLISAVFGAFLLFIGV